MSIKGFAARAFVVLMTAPMMVFGIFFILQPRPETVLGGGGVINGIVLVVSSVAFFRYFSPVVSAIK